MLTFKDAYTLVNAKRFLFEIPTNYNEIKFEGIMSKEENKPFIAGRLKLNWEFQNIPVELQELLRTKITADSLEEFKEDFNDIITELNEIENLEEYWFTKRYNEEDDYDEDWDYEWDEDLEDEDDEDEEEDNELNDEDEEAIRNFLRMISRNR